MKTFFAGVLVGITGSVILSPVYSPDVAFQPSSVQISSVKPVTLLFVGDIMLGRYVEQLIKSNSDNYPFERVSNLLSQADTVVANLEGPITSDHVQTPSLSTRFTFSPAIVPILRNHNINIVSLANNHTYDFGREEFAYTATALNAFTIDHFGNPYAFSDQYVLRKTINGQKLIFVGFNITNPSFDFTGAKKFVELLPRGENDFLIVFAHGGEEYATTSNKIQQNFYRSLIDSGVDLVVGAHPHVVQEVEQYKGKLIFYSLGNFIFDQYFSQDVQEELAIKMSINPGEVTYELVPLVSNRSQPEIMTDEAQKQFLVSLANRSSVETQIPILNGSITQPLTK
jgi:poly-gamma-glutamate synthesis protein (capsule biosynthesis protein)